MLRGQYRILGLLDMPLLLESRHTSIDRHYPGKGPRTIGENAPVGSIRIGLVFGAPYGLRGPLQKRHIEIM